MRKTCCKRRETTAPVPLHTLLTVPPVPKMAGILLQAKGLLCIFLGSLQSFPAQIHKGGSLRTDAACCALSRGAEGDQGKLRASSSMQ